MTLPFFKPAKICEQDVSKDGCMVTVEWSEPFISCAGSVSQYVLSVTPPTYECSSGSEECVLMTNQTEYNLTVTVDETYDITVRDDICSNRPNLITDVSASVTMYLQG